jgi:PAS domain S-box-containing protein
MGNLPILEGAGGTILIIEGDSGARRSLKQQLEKAGYRVIGAGGADEAIKALGREKLDLILLDCDLPGEPTGLRLFEQTKRAGRELPVILLTDVANGAAVVWALRAGVRDLISKSADYLHYVPEAVERVLKQVRTEQHLAQSEARLAAIIHSAMDAILTLDDEQKVTLFNAAAEKIFRCPASRALGRPVQAFIASASEGANDAFALPADSGGAKATGPAATCSELLGVRADGETFPVEASISSATVAGRECWVVIVRDITEKKKLEAQYLRSQRMESIGTLAGGIAHDLNNVLTPILMGVEVLKTKVRDPDGRAFLATLQSSAERGAEMVKQVLSFARGAKGQRLPLQLRQVIGDAEKLLKHTLPKSIEVRTDVAADLKPVSADATQLHQVLMNLCVNARDAMPRGGKLTIRADNTHLNDGHSCEHFSVRPGAYVRIVVSDTGAGMPANVLDKIFDPFFTTKEAGKGTGLGLSTVVGIVKSHGGLVRVTSEVGAGTQFSVYLPVLQSAELRKATAVPGHLPVGRGELILVVDDESSIREITKAILQTHGYRVLLARDGTEALALYVQHRRDIRVVVIDLMMPILNGPAAIRALREIDPQACIIAVSGVAANAKAIDSANLRVQAFLPKPFTAEKLLTTLREALNRPPEAVSLAGADGMMTGARHGDNVVGRAI